jgi:hypothetical protein
MTTLLYAIVDKAAGERCTAVPLPPGVGAAPVRLLGMEGLAAAVSTIAASEVMPTLSGALAYAKVVEALHVAHNIVPMRYGCLFENDAEVIDLLRVRAGHYIEILRRVDGCVEMGLRVSDIPDAAKTDSGRAPGAPADLSTPPSAFQQQPGSKNGSLGAAYLKQRAIVYAHADRRARDVAVTVERIRTAFAGRCVQLQIESAASQTALQSPRSCVSAYFLVQRSGLEDFRNAFHEFARTQRHPIVLTGPWPPYNFVAAQPTLAANRLSSAAFGPTQC